MSTNGYSFYIDLQARCVFMKYRGELTFDRLNDRNGKAESHPNFDTDFHSIVDLCGCEIHLSSEEIRHMANVIGGIYQNQVMARDAFIVDTIVGHGLTRMFTSSIPNHQAQVQIFDACDDGVANNLRKWLELPSGYIFPDFIRL